MDDPPDRKAADNTAPPDDFDAWFWGASLAEPTPDIFQSTAAPLDTVPPVAGFVVASIQSSSATPDPSDAEPSEIPTTYSVASPLITPDLWEDDPPAESAEDPPAVLPADGLIAAADTLADYGIEEIDEEFGYTFELDPALTIQLARLVPHGISRSATALAARLVAAYKRHGGITYRDLMFALRTLDRDVVVLTQLSALLIAADVRVKRAPHLYRFSRMLPADHALIETVFHPILIRQIAPAVAIQRLGYADIRLSQANQALLVDALERHQLSRAEEREVFADIGRVGGPATDAARPLVHQIISDNLWVVARVARLYLRRGLAFADLFQEGVLGLYRAVNGFDLALGFRFMIYANGWVRQGITRALSDKARLIRLPVHVSETLIVLERTTLRLEQAHERTPTVAELAEAMQLNARQILRLQMVGQPPLSLEAALAGGAGDLAAYMTDTDVAGDPEASALHQDLCMALAAALATLSERERRIITLRYGLGDDHVHTLEEVGTIIGVTRERVRQVENKALRKLGNPLPAHNSLRRYLNDESRVKLPADNTLPKQQAAEEAISAGTPCAEPLQTDSATRLAANDPLLSPTTDTADLHCTQIVELDDTAYSGEPTPLLMQHEEAITWQTAFLLSEDSSPVIHATMVPPKRGRGRPRKHSC